MIKSIKSFLIDNQQAKIFTVLCLSSAFCIIMIAFRLYYAGADLNQLDSVEDIVASRGFTFMFLVWNLFLAWIPYWIAISIEGFYKLSQSKVLVFGLIGLWLLFFPNAPYIITDLLHLHPRGDAPFWYDLMLIVSFAWTGMILGLISLHEIRIFIKKIYTNKLSWIFTVVATVLCGFGIFLGRCLRFNSWDIITNPLELAQDILFSLTNGMALKVTLIFSIFMILGYMTLNVLMGKRD